MPIKKVGLYELRANDIICSIYSKNENKWIREMKDMNNNLIYIDQLKVMRFIGENKRLILYDKNYMNRNNIFQLNDNEIIFSIYI